MIDRSYLPFQAARDYQDRGMMKWMGFFLSEHNTSLEDDRLRIDMTSNLTDMEKLVLIGQLYASQLQGMFVMKGKNVRNTYFGRVTEISSQEITIKTADKYQLLQVKDILSINMTEGTDFKYKRNL
ncbi:hypothetical protein [Streptococcus agalactiae]|uniref:hypothetical protein n=1 Tax=Streptococcus agalactiae TaxID=1311 RepID=UPI000810C32B|nr:hypothetical protein [Streptococcus agalactiae]OCM02398.1 hypothetical protein AX209_08515 [Streptococcus agalactiae]OTG52729.1 hypothetical protein B7931_03740 [Streptococcus agalactiae]